MSEEQYLPLAWDTEPVATQRREKNVLIANAKQEVANTLGGVIAVTTAMWSNDQWHSWALAGVCGVVTYWLTTYPYKRDLKKAEEAYIRHTGKPVDFV